MFLAARSAVVFALVYVQLMCVLWMCFVLSLNVSLSLGCCCVCPGERYGLLCRYVIVGGVAIMCVCRDTGGILLSPVVGTCCAYVWCERHCRH